MVVLKSYLHRYSSYCGSVKSYLHRYSSYCGSAKSYLHRYSSYCGSAKSYLHRYSSYCGSVQVISMQVFYYTAVVFQLLAASLLVSLPISSFSCIFAMYSFATTILKSAVQMSMLNISFSCTQTLMASRYF